jgi:hypothetical protein
MTKAQAARNAALHRLSRLNRWIAATTLIATGVLTDVVAHAFPGHTITKSAARSGAQKGSARPRGRHPGTERHHRPSSSRRPAGVASPTTTTAAPTTTAPPVVTTEAAPPPAPAPAVTAPPVVSGGS